MMNNLIKRVITGLFLFIFVGGGIWFNDISRFIIMILFSNISVYELNNALKNIKFNGLPIVAYIFNTIFLILAYKVNQNIAFPIFTLYILLLFVIHLLNEKIKFREIISNVFISAYITFPYAYIVLLNDRKWIIYIFAITSFIDSFAYFVGMSLGRHKLIERLSPKKTIEGAVGGVVGALVFTFIFALLFNIKHKLIIYLSAILISIVSQIGDLFASYIKRKSGIKDYGSILIGHGGVMDRFDSLLLVAPLVYILVYILG